MSFSFGSTATAAPTPAFSFGGTPAAPAPPAGGFSFGGNAAPAPPAFGVAPTAAFGSPASAAGFGAPSTPAFGAAPSSSGFSFGTSSAPAPSIFGTPTAAAPSVFGGFGSPAPAFGAATGPATAAAQAVQVSGGTPYLGLPSEIRQAIDTIHESIMKHKRAMISLQSMAPKALLPEDPLKMGTLGLRTDPEHPAPLAATIRQLHQNIASLENENGLQITVESFKADYETLNKQAVMYGEWQIESLAVRRGVHLKQQQSSQTDGKGSMGQNSAKAQLQAALDRQLAHVDRLDRMPSLYLWQVLEDFEKRLQNLKHHAGIVRQQIQNSASSEEPADIPSILQSQHRAVYNVLARLSNLHAQVEYLRNQYRFFEKGDNILQRAHFEEQQRNQRLNDHIQMQYVQAAAISTHAQPAAAPASGAFTSTVQPSAFGLGTTPAPAFGAPASTPAFGTAARNAFGAAPAPATTGFNFGGSTASANSAAAVATVGTSLFGGSGKPAPGATTPATSFSFNPAQPSSSSTPKSSKNKSRNKNRLGR